MRKDKMSSEKSRAGNGFVSRGDFIKVVYDDGGKLNAKRGVVISIDEFFITILAGEKHISINKRAIQKIINPAERNSEVGQ